MSGFKKFSTGNRFSPKPSTTGKTLAQVNSQSWENVLKEVDGREKREMYKSNVVIRPTRK
jgi:hypothetical protein